MADYADKPWVAGRARILLMLLLGLWIGGSPMWAASEKSNKTDRPQVPFGMTKLDPVQVGAYDSKAQPSAEALEAITEMTLKGWAVIRKYYPRLGVIEEGGSVSVNPSDREDSRFYAAFATDDPGRSPIPLISMICSLEAREVTGDLATLRAELLEAIKVDDYPTWTVERLRQGVAGLTQERTTDKGVKYRAPKKTLLFKQTMQLYAMTVALFEKDTKWAKWQEEVKKHGYSEPLLPDMHDFSNRLSHQLPVIIAPGATRGFLLYRPGWDIAQPRAKGEFEERADVVLVKRAGTTFQVEQFPIYLTNEQKEWSPDWIDARDEAKDMTLLGRKFEEDWTRFDGPYLWFKKDQLNGEDTYRATVKFQEDEIVIEGERFVLRRGGVVRTARDPLYDPANMKRFVAGAEQPPAALTVDPPELDTWPAIWRMLAKNINETCYRNDGRQLLWYKTGENSWSGSIFPRTTAEQAVLRPMQPVATPTSGIVARFSGAGAEQPSDVQVLDDDQKTSVGIAVALMNRCLANAGGAELNALRVSLPREPDNQTPIYFYSVRNGTSVRKSPSSLVVVLSEGYFNGYVSAFNRLLWVLEKPVADDAGKVAAISQSIAKYLREAYPSNASNPPEPEVAAWASILQQGAVEELFNASVLPSQTKVVTTNPPRPVGSEASATPAGPQR